MSTCRKCGEEVRWVRTPNGKMMPVQHDPMCGELVLVDEGDTHPTCRIRRTDLDPTHTGRERYTCHFDFCG